MKSSLLVSLAIVLVFVWNCRGGFLSEADKANCNGSPLCRTLYQTRNYMMPNQEAFALLSSNSIAESEEDQLRVANLIIAELALNPRRCSPNTYWAWDAVNQSGQCLCYFDRDCSQAATLTVQTVPHPILLFVGCALIVAVVVFIVIRIVYSPTLIVEGRSGHNMNS